MKYCRTELHYVAQEDIENMLSALKEDQFSGRGAAYRLSDGSYSIDSSNDIRAIYDEDTSVLKFLCRYQKDVDLYDEKIRIFSVRYQIETIDE
jgi:hypothetical protein